MSTSSIPVIAIDGPTASGKGTVAHLVADKLGFHYLDSGALYRLTALTALRRGTNLHDEHALSKLAEHLPCTFSGAGVMLAHEDVTDAIRAEEVGNVAWAFAKRRAWWPTGATWVRSFFRTPR
jgi:cytidylate kinase